MTSSTKHRLWPRSLFFLSLTGGLANPGAAERLTVESAVTSLPSLIGTAPSGLAWSSDGKELAFLWNDKALPFRDVWVVSVEGGAPRRLTDLARDSPGSTAPSTDPVRSLAEALQQRTRRGVSEVAWTPDGRSLVFGFQGDLFQMRADGKEVEKLTRSGKGPSHLAFSPDGRFLSFIQEGDLWLWNTATQEMVQATRIGVPSIGTVPGTTYFRPEVELGTYVWDSDREVYRWSPDSRHIALHYVDRRQMRRVPFPYYLGEETALNFLRRGYPGDYDEIRSLAVYSVAAGRLRRVDLPDKTYRRFGGFDWAPDGKRLLVDQCSEDSQERWLYGVEVEDLSFEEIWHDRRETRIYTLADRSLWASDGRDVLFLGDLEDRYRVYRLRPGTRTPQAITPAESDVLGAFERRGKDVYFVSNRKSPYEVQVYRVSEDGGEVSAVSRLAGTHEPAVSPDGTSVALLHSSDVSPIDLYLVGARGGGAERRVTESPPKEFSAHPWIAPRYVTFPGRDGFTLHGRLIEPPNLDRRKKHPVILGPVYSNTVRNRWSGSRGTHQQYLALEGGYLVFQVDVRGSTGYGRDFREKFLMDAGGGDIEDLASAVDYLKTLPYVDGERIGIWGSSYGGTLTVFALFRKPGLFKAGVAGAPAVDARFFGTDDVSIARLPHTQPEAYRRISAIYEGERLQDPLLIIHGMLDDVVPFKTSVMLAERLMLLGKNFDFAFAPAAGHGWAQREHYAVFLMKKLVEHFDRHLGRGPR
jgi:dipeptidyl-peptidase-4